VVFKHNGSSTKIQRQCIGAQKQSSRRKNMKQILAAFTLVLGLSSVSQAGILIEPYLGYETGDLSYTPVFTGTGTEFKDVQTGTGYGLRLGYKFLIPWVALDYSGVSGKAKTGASAIGFADTDYTRSSLGAVVGADLPIIRLWAGYGLSNELAYKATASTAASKFKGSYVKAGVGLKLIPFLSVNLEYKMNTYTKFDNGTTESDIKDFFSSHKNDMLMISLSAPFNL
jgi:hypothetical protein